MNYSRNRSPFSLSSPGSTSLLPLFLAFAALCLCAYGQPAIDSEEIKAQKQKRLTEFFEPAHKALDSALDRFDKQLELPEADELEFYEFLRSTKEDEELRIGSYLQAAGRALGVSDITERRAAIASLRAEIRGHRESITRYKRRRVSAPEKTINPIGITKNDCDEKIAELEESISEAEAKIGEEKIRLLEELRETGLELDPESVDMLLESITGDEFINVTVVFDNAKRFALELERLTAESGEDLVAAQKYYGVYLMLLKTIDQLQLQFIANVDQVYYPKLEAYISQGKQNIEEAHQAMQQGGDIGVLKGNIENNRLTIEAARFYKEGLLRQRSQMEAANEICKINILTAVNTYKTATLSKDVARLISVSRKAFDAITNLAAPDLRPFKNQKMKEIYSRMTQELKKKK